MSDCKHIGIRKFEFVARTQFIKYINLFSFSHTYGLTLKLNLDLLHLSFLTFVLLFEQVLKYQILYKNCVILEKKLRKKM